MMTTKRYEKGKLYQLSLSEIAVDQTQPRKYFDEQALLELKGSIEKHGVLQPVLVRRAKEGGFLLVSGERRYQASAKAGLASIPAIITDGDPTEIAIVENLLRENLTAIEEAEAIAQLKDSHHYELCDLAQAIGKAESTLCEILSITKLPDEIKDDCRSDPAVSRKALIEVARQPTWAKMKAMYKRFKASGAHGTGIGKVTARGAGEPITLVKKFIERIAALQVGELDKEQKEALANDIEALRLVLNKKMRGLKSPGSAA